MPPAVVTTAPRTRTLAARIECHRETNLRMLISWSFALDRRYSSLLDGGRLRYSLTFPPVSLWTAATVEATFVAILSNASRILEKSPPESTFHHWPPVSVAMERKYLRFGDRTNAIAPASRSLPDMVAGRRRRCSAGSSVINATTFTVS